MTVHKRMSHRRHRRFGISGVRSRSLTPSVKPSSSPVPQQRPHRRARPHHKRPLFSGPSKRDDSRSLSPPASRETQQERRKRWAAAAAETRRIVLGDGKYVEPRTLPCNQVLPYADHAPYPQVGFVGLSKTASPPPPSPTHYDVVHDVGAQIEYSRQGTSFYPHYCEALASWRTRDGQSDMSIPFSNTAIDFTKFSTLTAAHRLSQSPSSPTVSPTLSVFRPSTRIGVLSFASPKKGGGSYLLGADDQEARIARSTSLIANLESETAAQFYAEHRRLDDGSGLHNHSMLYSPGVVVLRAQDDEASDKIEHPASFDAPYRVNVLSAVPVNAAAIRAKHMITSADEPVFAAGIESAMRERMARALHVFRLHRNTTLVLGAFGEGSNEIPPALVGRLWAELLVCGDGEHAAEFGGLFETVTFAVPRRAHKEFREAFEQRCLEVELEGALKE